MLEKLNSLNLARKAQIKFLPVPKNQINEETEEL